VSLEEKVIAAYEEALAVQEAESAEYATEGALN
jgi:hypothetical protein